MAEDELMDLTDNDINGVLGGDDDTEQTKATDNQSEEVESEEEQITDDDLTDIFSKKKKKKGTNESDSQINNTNTTDKFQQQQRQTTNNPQDLIDANGNIIAKAGAERRFYEENRKLKQERQHFNSVVFPQIKQEYDNMQQELAQYKGMISGLRADDLSPQDIQGGLDFVRQWKQNPQQVIKFLLTNLQSNGIDVDIDGMRSGIQATAMKKMIQDELAPFTKERELEQQRIEQEYEVTNQYNSFISQYPDATIHDKELAFMIRNNPNISPEVAYYKLKNYYLQNGYDWNQTLEEIKQNQSQQPNQGIPMTPTVSASVVQNPQQRVAEIGTSYKDIINGAIMKAGFND